MSKKTDITNDINSSNEDVNQNKKIEDEKKAKQFLLEIKKENI